MTERFAVAAFWVSMIAYLPFIWEILVKGNRQNPVTWFGFFIINGVILASSVIGGADNQAAIAYAVGIGTITALSVWWGQWRFLRMDKIILALIVIIMAGWLIAGPLPAMVLGIAAVYVSTTPLWQQLRKNSGAQPPLPWILWAVGSVFQLTSYGPFEEWTLTEALPTFSYLGQQMSILTFIFLPRFVRA